MPAVMGHWKSWHVREPGRHAGIRRAGVKALALLALTVAAAVVLTVLYHLPWQPVVVTILLLVPALYVAWLAVPGVISVARRSAFGRLPSRWDPVELGVHRVIGGGPMPPDVRRLTVAPVDTAQSLRHLFPGSETRPLRLGLPR